MGRVGRARLLDDLVGSSQDRLRDRQAERLGGLEVDDELKPCGLFHREVGGRSALKDLVDVGRGAPTRFVHSKKGAR